MNRRSALFAVLLSVLLALTGGGIASAAPGSLDLGSSGLDIPGIGEGCSKDLVDGDWRLGPETLSTLPPVATQLEGYRRTGTKGKNNQEFLQAFWIGPKDTGKWNYPPENGYVLDDAGKPIKSEKTMVPGDRMDRYGGEGGTFMAPEGTPYPQRSLSPGNLVNSAAPSTCNYHDYIVIRPFKVYTGDIAPGFDQPGGGKQYEIVDALLEPNPACGTASVQFLICAGYLVKIYPGPL